jgi:hypothetical protein
MFRRVQVDGLQCVGDAELLAWPCRTKAPHSSLRSHFKNHLSPQTSPRKSEAAQIARMLHASLSSEHSLPVDMVGYLLGDLGLSLCLNVAIGRVLVDAQSLHPAIR